MLAATLSSDSSSTASPDTFVVGSGDSQVFVYLPSSVVVDGASQSASVSGLDQSTSFTLADLGSVDLMAVVQGNTPSKVQLRQGVIDFPAGAIDISYVFSQGFDASLYPIMPSTSTRITPVASIFVIASFLLLLFV